MTMNATMPAPTGSTGRQALGVRGNLAILAICCILPIAVVSTTVILHFYEHERDQLVANAVAQAGAIVDGVDAEFDGTKAALQALSTSQQLGAGKLAAFHTRAQAALAYLAADSIVIVDRGGALRMSTSRPFGTPLPALARTPLLARVAATGKPAVSDLFVGPVAGTLIYSVAVPLFEDGVVTMTLNATAAPARLAARLRTAALPDNWRAVIADASGRIAARSHEPAKYVGRLTSAALRARLAASGSGSFETLTLDGLPVMTAYARSARSGWSVALGIPLAELTAPLRATLASLILATLAALALGLALAWRFGGAIARSVLALVAPAQALGEGRRLPIPALPVGECNVLGAALERAAASVSAARAAAHESERRLSLAADAAHLGVWVRDLVGTDIWASDNWRALFGFAPAEAITLERMLAHVHPDDRSAVARTLDHVRVQGGRYEMEYRIARPGSGEHWIASFGNAENDARGQPALVRGVSLDITARKQAELDMQLKQKEVTVLARVAVLGELSGALAHELNQPLTAILSNAQAALRFLARTPPDVGEVGEILRDIVEADQRAGEIIRRLRRLFEQGSSARQRIDADALIDGVLALLRNDMINHGVAAAPRLDAAGARIDADPVQLQQVLINLVMNACDAMAATPAGARVVGVRSSLRADGQLQVSVSDAGTGIAADIAARLFDPFFTTKAGGMGLGLSICRNIALAHGGALWAENNAGGGASFHLLLPAAPP